MMVAVVICSPALAQSPQDGLGAASAAVQRIETRLHSLGERVQKAEQRYATALQGVAAGVTDTIAAERDRSSVRSVLATSNTRLQDQMASLYASGGSLAETSALLAPDGLLTYDQSQEAESSAVAQTVATAKAQQSMAGAATAQVSTGKRHADRSIATERSVAGIARRVGRLLTREQGLMTAARQQLAHQQAVAAAARAALAAQTAAFAGETQAGVGSIGVLPPSATYLALYRHAAATCPGLPWTLLAAIGQVESGHGRNDGPSSAGAEGPMQFMPATFASYAVDGDHDGRTEIDDPADAIFTAAHYLCSNGGGRGSAAMSNAVFDYNHATWYVDLVLGLSQRYAVDYSH
jgi:membrane-bound lytic murein transglycosylase B